MLFQAQATEASALQADDLGELAFGHAAQCGMRTGCRCGPSIIGVGQIVF
jgi:hypothetical protein